MQNLRSPGQHILFVRSRLFIIAFNRIINAVSRAIAPALTLGFSAQQLPGARAPMDVLLALAVIPRFVPISLRHRLSPFIFDPTASSTQRPVYRSSEWQTVPDLRALFLETGSLNREGAR
ncbi:MAG: hypothetical protein JOY93_06085 [Acidobacteriales bacterium]|nr:hypothetical protein [Terriglobales bacterium]